MSKWIKVGSNALEVWSNKNKNYFHIFKNNLKIQRMKPMKPKRKLSSEEEEENE